MRTVVLLVIIFLATFATSMRFIRAPVPTRTTEARPFIVYSDTTIDPNDRTRSPTASYLTPSQLRSVYNLPTSPTAGSGKTIGIVVAFGASTIESDFAYFNNYFNLPECTSANGCFRKVNQTGGSLYPADDSGWSQETALDVEWAHVVAPGARILLVVANSAYSNDLSVAISYAADNSDYVSMSFGSIENARVTYESCFTKSTASFFAATGDDGAQPGVSYPSTSPQVVAVGGTTIYRDNGVFSREDAWSGSGGGCSKVFNAPYFQTSNPNYSSFNCSGLRTVPDASYLADPSSGVLVYSTSQSSCTNGNCFYIVGGTSLATPLFAARAAVRGDVVKPSYLYQNNIIYRDITSGSNGFSARAGLDQVTGLGSWIGDYGQSGTTTASPPTTTTTATPTTTRTPTTTNSLTTRVATTTTTPTTTASSSVVNRFTTQEITAIVNAHNQIRTGVGLTELVSWSTTVEDFAVSYASQCKSNGQLMAHNQNRYLADGTYVGENIFASTSRGTLTGVEAVNSWGSEKTYYNYTSNTCQSGQQCGHYTQIVWRTSINIGCARVKCSNIQYGNTILCDYSPGGNYVGRKPY
ncbi:PR12 [Acrasis kona]|uniref:PR12 n=1 Tax=Acrasis kona TaxID=1008807 RepID=A0AAW2ZNH5_9EUKA